MEIKSFPPPLPVGRATENIRPEAECFFAQSGWIRNVISILDWLWPGVNEHFAGLRPVCRAPENIRPEAICSYARAKTLSYNWLRSLAHRETSFPSWRMQQQESVAVVPFRKHPPPHTRENMHVPHGQTNPFAMGNRDIPPGNCSISIGNRPIPWGNGAISPENAPISQENAPISPGNAPISQKTRPFLQKTAPISQESAPISPVKRAHFPGNASISQKKRAHFPRKTRPFLYIVPSLRLRKPSNFGWKSATSAPVSSRIP